MAIEIKVPSVGESISEVTLVKWIKKDGDWVDRDEVIAELESEKATFEINATHAGILKTIAKEGDTLKIGDVACSIDDTAAKPEKVSEPEPQKKPEEKKSQSKEEPKQETEKKQEPQTSDTKSQTTTEPKATPVAAAILADKKVDVKTITPSGRTEEF